MKVDIFYSVAASFKENNQCFSIETVCAWLQPDPVKVRRFDIEGFVVARFSFTQPAAQGSRFNCDMNGTQMTVLFAELDI